MSLLDGIVTENTPFIELQDAKLSNNAKTSIMVSGKKYKDLELFEKKYLTMIKKYKGDIYYLKNPYVLNIGYFDVMHELLGSYLASSIDLDTVKYQIAKEQGHFVIASKDFKESCCKYYYPGDFCDKFNYNPENNIDSIKFLETLCLSKDEKERLIEQFCKILALDIYMMQVDRNNHNIQFKIDEKDRLSFAPLYDYSLSYVFKDDMSNFNIENPFVLIRNPENIKELIKRYPALGDYLNKLIKYNLIDCIDSIFDEYSFSKKEIEYEDTVEFYKKKSLIYNDFLKRNIF